MNTPVTPSSVRNSFSTQLALCASAASAMLLLAGCGGSADVVVNPPIVVVPGPTPLDEAAGFYAGTTASGRGVSVIVLETGRFYALYGPAGNPTSSAIEGLLTGNGDASGSTFTSSTAHNVSFALQTSTPAAMSATFAFSAYFDANLAYPGGATDSFVADYLHAYEIVPAVASVSASYAGQLASLGGGVDNASLVISPSGALSVATSGGCVGAGTIYPHSVGNVYDVTITYGSGCAASGQTLIGHAKYDGALRSLVAVTTSSDFYDVAMFVGTR